MSESLLIEACHGSQVRGDARADSDTDARIEIDPEARIGVWDRVGIKATLVSPARLSSGLKREPPAANAATQAGFRHHQLSGTTEGR
jgi:hypothetical protein